jgi:hypothetical protein
MEPTINQDSPAWMFFVHASFAVSCIAMIIGIWWLPAELWVKGFLTMGFFGAVQSSFTLSKALRDQHESRKIHHRISEAKTAHILKEYEINP